MSILHRSKAPNILILTEHEKDFKNIKSFIRNLLGVNSYTIYNIKLSQINTAPSIWIDYCHLLVTIEKSNHLKEIYNEQHNYMKKYLETDGKILSFPSCLEESSCYKIENFDGNNYLIYNSKYEFELRYENNKETFSIENLNNYIYSYNKQHWVSKVHPNNGDVDGYKDNDSLKKSEKKLVELFKNLFFNEFNLKIDNLGTQELESYALIVSNQLESAQSKLENLLNNSVDPEVGLQNVDKDNTRSLNYFKKNDYFDNLTTKRIGHIILYSSLTTSTMNAIKKLPYSVDNVIAIARQQNRGVGSNNNEWLSPIGCAMFTVFINFDLNIFPKTRLCLLEFAGAIACVEAIILTAGYENVPIKIKWPNDVFHETNSKLGGILVRITPRENKATAEIGIGVNIDNEYPTMCVNKIFESLNLEKWSCEKFVAKCLNRLEYYIECLQNLEKLETFIISYQNHWLHSNQRVHVENLNEKVEVIGIDDFGFLKVKRMSNEIRTLDSVGNHFDMIRNLIVSSTFL